MKKNISINLQGLIFHIEEDGYEQLGRYLAEVKAHFARFRGHQDIVADIEGRMAEIFAQRLSPTKQVITLADVQEMEAKMGRVRDFAADVDADEDDEAADFATNGSSAGSASASGYANATATAPPPTPSASANTAAADEPRRLYRDTRHGKIAGVAAGLGHYFHVNPVWVRLAFVALVLARPLFRGLLHGFDFDGDNTNFGGFNLGGLGVISYLILWIVLPKRDDAPEPIATLASSGPWAGRRLFRDVDGGKVGGVALGLAHYFQVDVVLVRVLLLAGFFAGGFTFILYLILWVAVPVASTVSEKLQMRGNDVTLAGIASSLDATEGQPLGATVNARPVGRFLEGAAKGARPVFNGVGTIIRWSTGALLVLISGLLLISLAAALGGVLGIVPADSVIHLGTEQETNALLRNVTSWGALALFLATAIPTLAFLLLGLRLLLRRPVLGRTASLSLLGLWILGLVGTGAAAATLTNEFRTRSSVTQTRQLAVLPGRSLVLDMSEQSDYLDRVRVRFAAADSGQAPSAELEFSARGRNQATARQTALQSVDYVIGQRDSTLTLAPGLTLRDGAPYRSQRLTATLRLPLDRTYRLTPRFLEQLDDNNFVDNYPPRDNQAHRVRLTVDGRLRCLDCPPRPAGEGDGNGAGRNFRDGDDNDGDDDGVDLNINGERMRIRVDKDQDGDPDVQVDLPVARFDTSPASYGTGRQALAAGAEFSEVDAAGDFRVLVRQGSGFKAEAAGRPEDMNEMRLRIENGKLVIRRRNADSFLPSMNFNNHPVLITIEVPELRALDLAGACQADVSGFDSDNLRLEASGACITRLDARITNLSLDLSGACAVELRGQADQLRIEGSGGTLIEALALSTRRTSLDLSGISQARVQVSEELNADLSGTSRVRYRGQPRITQELSGTSRLEQL
ncbi:PspC domain-containing protein [uncultured Hymenobacter sp.]|uniref:PspC domain-containing protein n=1 Tax=uncultured Hymenobacter sp. TaxID=170016 RepID=UPI0035CC86EF